MCRKQTTLAPQLLVGWGSGAEACWWGGSGWGRRLGLLLMLLLLPPEALPSRGSWCPHLGSLLSLSIQSAPREKRPSAREGQSGSRQRELAAWSHFPVASSHPPPPSLPSQTGHSRPSPGPKESPKSAELLPQSSYRIKRTQAF